MLIMNSPFELKGQIKILNMKNLIIFTSIITSLFIGACQQENKQIVDFRPDTFAEIFAKGIISDSTMNIRPYFINQDDFSFISENAVNLDDDKLRELRKAAIDAAIDGLEIFQGEEHQELIGAYLQRSPVTNRFQPFCMAIVQVLTSI